MRLCLGLQPHPPSLRFLSLFLSLVLKDLVPKTQGNFWSNKSGDVQFQLALDTVDRSSHSLSASAGQKRAEEERENQKDQEDKVVEPLELQLAPPQSPVVGVGDRDQGQAPRTHPV
ncbi:Hypothetical predicted protein [Marmota monax]|uniref:Uncharacterized protein n=1 Tax=Marmota monax TaxID=9995 RepID=A0A5E4CMI9_MARMO|nr:Hypothetical predicted protein [Marmota monax]